MAEELKEGQAAPDFTLRDEETKEVTLSDLRGQTVVLMFFPNAFSPICDGEFCELRDSWDAWAATGASVFGISRDNPWALKAWKEQQRFPARFLSDMNGAVARDYGAWNERGFANRRTIVIDKEGTIIALDETANPGVARDQTKLREAVTSVG